MEDHRQIILDAKAGQIVPIVKEIEMSDPVDFFARLSDYGRAKNCCLFESRDYLAGSSALTFGTARPALYLTGTGKDFSIQALSGTGRRMLGYLADKERFSFCESVDFGDEEISGRIKENEGVIDEQSRLLSIN